MLPPIAEAVGGEIEVLMDGGIRRGSRRRQGASPSGARAVMIGRAYLWGLAVNGQAGVENVLDVLRSGIDSTLLGMGEVSIHDVDADDVVVPPDFSPLSAVHPPRHRSRWRRRRRYWVNAQSRSAVAEALRASSVGAPRTPTMMRRPARLADATMHQPAWVVCPVLMPSAPG